MPHVVLKGPLTPEDVWLGFRPQECAEAGTIVKATECYLKDDKSVALIKAVLVERGFTRNFLVRLTHHDGELTLSVEPMTNVDRSEGVKRCIGLFAWLLMQAEPLEQVLRTNIAEHVRGPGGTP